MKNINQSSAYSVILALLIIWFLLVLSTGIFNLILVELKDNKAMWDYIKSYAGAESAQELALLKIKKYWYAYYDKIDHDVNNRSIVLANNPLDNTKFNKNNDIFLSYDIWSKVENYDWTLKPLSYNIIPLFYLDDDWEHKVKKVDLSIVFWTESDLAWNAIWNNNWLSWVWSNTLWVKKILTSGWFKYDKEELDNFLSTSDTNYLVLLNSNNEWIIKYKLTALNSWEYFTKPKTTIISSAQIWNYMQNLSTDLDNTEFLNMLKYSIYSN